MKSISPFWFAPPVKDEAEPSAEFELRPLDQRTLYLVQMDMDFKRGICGVNGAIAAFEYSVVNWRGLNVEFSRQAKRDVTEGAGELKWTLRLAQIAAELYKRSFLKEEDSKNS